MTQKADDGLADLLARLRSKDAPEALVDHLRALHARIDDLAFNQRMLDKRLHALVDVADRIPATPQSYPATAQITPTMIRDDAPGFYALETNDRGAPFRWTGPDRDFHFTVSIDRSSPRRLVFRDAQTLDGAQPAGVRLFVDSLEVELKTAGATLHAELPPLPSTERPTHLAFLLDRVASPAQLGDSKDTRLLGLTFYQLDIG